MLAGAFAQTKKLGDGLLSEGAGALFAGSNQTTTLDCAGGGAHIFGSHNTLTLTGGCTWLDMVGSDNAIIVALANGANIEFAGSNNAITWTSPEGEEPVVRHMGSGNTLSATPRGSSATLSENLNVQEETAFAAKQTAPK